MTTMLPEEASLSRLALRVRDLDVMLSYYLDVLGFEVVDEDPPLTTISLTGQLFRIDLVADPSAPVRPYPCIGLYHFALVVPDRPALGAILRHLIDRRAAFEGMSDHAVSEALYLRDPEHNGIELYRDRPKEEWPRDPSGGVAMVSDPLDIDGVLAAAEVGRQLHPQTRFGHVHMHVPDLAMAEAFYSDILGLSVTSRALRSALFFAAGDYHHHVGANTWAPNTAVPDGATGLMSYTWRLPGPDEPPALIDPAGAEVRFEAA